MMGMGLQPLAWPAARESLGRTGPPGQFPVRDGAAPGNAAQFLPDPELEGRALKVQGQVLKIRRLPRKKPVQFLDHPADRGIRAVRRRKKPQVHGAGLCGKLQGCQSLGGKGKNNPPQGSVLQANGPFPAWISSSFPHFPCLYPPQQNKRGA